MRVAPGFSAGTGLPNNPWKSTACGAGFPPARRDDHEKVKPRLPPDRPPSRLGPPRRRWQSGATPFRPKVTMRLLARLLIPLLCLLPAGLRAQEACDGQDLLAAMPPAELAALRAAADAAPFPRGNYWRATRNGQEITLIGTYHLNDPRHAAVVEAALPRLRAASRLMVEAGPEEEAQLMRELGRNTDLLLLPDGRTLLDLMPAEDWELLAEELRARSMPPMIASRMRPWYLAVLLAVPPCLMPEMTARPEGLDALLIGHADELGLPLSALEPWDTAFRVFETMPEATQVDMIRSTLALGAAEDHMVTLANAYFAEDSRLFWEYMRHVSLTLPGMTPERVAAEFAMMEEALMNARNRAWIPPIEAAAAEGPVFVAFGALHLAGEEGVLNLLAQNGWQLERLPLP